MSHEPSISCGETKFYRYQSLIFVSKYHCGLHPTHVKTCSYIISHSSSKSAFLVLLKITPLNCKSVLELTERFAINVSHNTSRCLYLHHVIRYCESPSWRSSGVELFQPNLFFCFPSYPLLIKIRRHFIFSLHLELNDVVRWEQSRVPMLYSEAPSGELRPIMVTLK